MHDADSRSCHLGRNGDPLNGYDAIVVGLGAFGSATAWQLAARGGAVLGFDRFHPPHEMGGSTGRSRIIREAYWESPFYVPMVQRAYQLWEELERRSGRPLLHRTGGLVIGPPDGALVAGALASAQVHRVPHRRLTAAEIRARYPAFEPDDSLEGVWESRAGVLSPEACIEAMLAEATRGGATLRFEMPVLEWSAHGDHVDVRTAAGRFTARRLVLAAGPWMAGSLPSTKLPLEVARQAMFWLMPGAEGAGGAGGAGPFAPERFPVWLWETPEGEMYYGFPDLGDGPKVARHHGGAVVDPETVDRRIRPEEAEAMLAFLGRAIPGLRGPVFDARVCLYTNTPDEHFILDRHPAHPEVLLASPCSGHGFKFAPALGEALADQVMDRSSRLDLSPFRLERFKGLTH